MEWIDVQTSNESIFPLDGPYPDDLERTARHIFKRLFRVRLGAWEQWTRGKWTPHSALDDLVLVYSPTLPCCVHLRVCIMVFGWSSYTRYSSTLYRYPSIFVPLLEYIVRHTFRP
jgi:hypothetical protein